VVGISTGVLNLRRTADGRDGWFDLTPDNIELDARAGDAIDAGFVARDRIQASLADPQVMLDSVFCVAPGVRLKQELTPTGEGFETSAVTLETTQGIRGSVNIDQRVAQLVGRNDGQRPFSQLIADMAATLGMDPGQLVGPMLTVGRLLLEKGILRVLR